METIDFFKTHKDLYTATSKVKEVTADKAKFLAVEGQGAPGGPVFEQVIQALFSVVFTMKFTLKFAGGVDFKICRLEWLLLTDPCKTPKDQWQWRFLIRVPDEISAKDLKQAIKTVKEKKEFDASAVKLISWKEGPAVQVMHVGPYDQVGGSYEQLDAYGKVHGLTVIGPAHEIYISDPHRVAPEKIKTIVRLSVKK
jgi:hypothetical protein